MVAQASSLRVTKIINFRFENHPHRRTRSHVKQTTTAMTTPAADPAYLGIDFGTSGARCCTIDAQGKTLSTAKASYASSAPDQLGSAWKIALFELLDSIPEHVKSRLVTLAIDGTSSTTLLIDGESGALLQPPKMYSEAQHPSVVAAVKAISPVDHTVTASTSTLCKVMTWHQQGMWQSVVESGGTPIVLHQSDWIASLLHGKRGVTDWNNALKLGFDPASEEWPDFICDQDFAQILPQVVCAPGTPVAPITADVAAQIGFPATTVVCAGTTDSIAAFLAAGCTEPGQAVTSLGSTLAIKLLSEHRADNAAYGIYSHRLGDAWLVGGASNTGGAVLKKYFTDGELRELTPKMDAKTPTGLKYTVLLGKGERFPVNDPEMQPVLEPRPADDAVFLQGMLEAMAATEGAAYRKLAALGATPVREVITSGGGAGNPVWTELRRNALGVAVRAAVEGEAAYGAAVLARQGHELMKLQGTVLL